MITIVQEFKDEPLKEADLFKGVTNDDAWVAAKVKNELQDEERKLKADQKEIERRTNEFEEKRKREIAKKKFIPKVDFLLREQVERRTQVVIKVDEYLRKGDLDGLEFFN